MQLKKNLGAILHKLENFTDKLRRRGERPRGTFLIYRMQSVPQHSEERATPQLMGVVNTTHNPKIPPTPLASFRGAKRLQGDNFAGFWPLCSPKTLPHWPNFHKDFTFHYLISEFLVEIQVLFQLLLGVSRTLFILHLFQFLASVFQSLSPPSSSSTKLGEFMQVGDSFTILKFISISITLILHSRS